MIENCSKCVESSIARMIDSILIEARQYDGFKWIWKLDLYFRLPAKYILSKLVKIFIYQLFMFGHVISSQKCIIRFVSEFSIHHHSPVSWTKDIHISMVKLSNFYEIKTAVLFILYKIHHLMICSKEIFLLSREVLALSSELNPYLLNKDSYQMTFWKINVQSIFVTKSFVDFPTHMVCISTCISKNLTLQLVNYIFRKVDNISWNTILFFEK